MRWTVIGLAVLGWGLQGSALAQNAQATGRSAVASAEAERRVDINEYVVRGNSVLDALVIERVLNPFLGPGRTMKDTEAARDALLAAYQAAGYQSVYVDLPEQQVVDGVVFLQVNETRVGRVRVTGAQFTSPLAVRDQVPALQEGRVPDFNQAQAELTVLNRTGKRQVMPLVKQGALPGTMDVDLKVEDQSPWRATLGLNNDYSADTRHLRATVSLGHDNLWQLGHSASISFFGTPQDLQQTKVWSGSYLAPLHGTDWGIEVSGYSSDSSVATLGGTNVLGKGHSLGLKANYTVPDTGAWWHALSLGVDFKSNKESLRLDGTEDDVPLDYAPITLVYSGFLQTERGQYSLGLSLVAGTGSLLGYGSDAKAFDYKRYKASPSFLVLKADTNGSYSFARDWQLGWRLAAQLTDGALVSGEQMAAGGMNSVRGYLAAESTGDVGVIGSLEWRTAPITYFSPRVENWRWYVFADAGHLRLRNPLPEQQSRFSLSSLGLGTNFRLGSYLSGRIDLSYPLKAGTRTKAHDPRINFSINASY